MKLYLIRLMKAIPKGVKILLPFRVAFYAKFRYSIYVIQIKKGYNDILLYHYTNPVPFDTIESEREKQNSKNNFLKRKEKQQ